MDQEKLTHVRRISLVFFYLLTGIYLFSWLLWKNDVMVELTQHIAENLTIPLYIVGAAFIISSSAQAIDTDNPEKKPILIAIVILTVALFLGLLLLDIFSRA